MIATASNSLTNVIEFNEASTPKHFDLKALLSDITRLYAMMGYKKKIIISLLNDHVIIIFF